MIHTYMRKTVKTGFLGLSFTLLLLFTLSACTSSEAELAQKVQTLSKGEKITALHTEIQTAITNLNESFENGDYSPSSKFNPIENYDDIVSYVGNDYGGSCFQSNYYPHKEVLLEAILNVSNVLLTSRYTTDLSSDELINIFKTKTGLPLHHLIQPQTESDHIIVAFRFCSIGSHDYPWSRFYLLDHDGYRSFTGGELTESWTFPDGEALFIRSQRPAGTEQIRLYRIYNDGTRWQSSELIFDPEQYGQASVTFDEDGDRFTAYIPSYGGWQPPCEYTAEFTEEYGYERTLNWNVTLSYTFDDGLFTLGDREYGDWIALATEPDSIIATKMDTFAGSELQRFCVSGTLRPVLP